MEKVRNDGKKRGVRLRQGAVPVARGGCLVRVTGGNAHATPGSRDDTVAAVSPATLRPVPAAPAPEPVDLPAEIANKAARPAEQRLNVRFTPEGYAQLQALARRGDKTVSETVRDALGLLGWLDERMDEGSQLIIKQKDGQMFVVAKPKTLR